MVNFTADGTGEVPGELTLREAVGMANDSSGAVTITFDPTVFATAQTIALTAGQLELSNTSGTETIIGPAAGLTISGGDQNRIFQVDSSVTASISGLTITGGNSANYGGGLLNDGTLSLTDCTVSGNSASRNGGGVDNSATADADRLRGQRQLGRLWRGRENFGTLTLTDCTVSGNSASYGGGLFNFIPARRP